MFKTIAFPVIKRYEIQLFKKEFNRLVNSKKVSQNKNINNKEIINIDENYNAVNYWKIEIDSNIIIIPEKMKKMKKKIIKYCFKFIKKKRKKQC